ncbi:hypothetical protein B0G81_7795 [Paraburkholderia sp. BL6665CI2N2]|uniref:hypothetical protein n=1 Tax=Paraburkholderia sp. BL6665CI2N2 TaxID=1938806 RepID=UPI0010EF9325|nr:hypothetical protein [Paraburkholderia sp. BL6665CI2N2]TDY16708.1 hypothetical protein B0G81_7795 [Paraburkholderia sp. BL6665CI2N2]
MNRVPKGSYTKEFREEAVKLVLVDGLTSDGHFTLPHLWSRKLPTWQQDKVGF